MAPAEWAHSQLECAGHVYILTHASNKTHIRAISSQHASQHAEQTTTALFLRNHVFRDVTRVVGWVVTDVSEDYSAFILKI